MRAFVLHFFAFVWRGVIVDVVGLLGVFLVGCMRRCLSFVCWYNGDPIGWFQVWHKQ